MNLRCPFFLLRWGYVVGIMKMEVFAMRLYLVRHGQTDMNKRNMFYGWTDADINETGIQQAEMLRQYFRQIPIDAIYSSDLRRAAHTAEIIAAGKDMKVHYDSAFRELYYGDWENQTAEYIETNYKEELRGWVTDWKDLAMPNGEKFSDFYNRVAAGGGKPRQKRPFGCP